jgi:hypothetical protein
MQCTVAVEYVYVSQDLPADIRPVLLKHRSRILSQAGMFFSKF